MPTFGKNCNCKLSNAHKPFQRSSRGLKDNIHFGHSAQIVCDRKAGLCQEAAPPDSSVHSLLHSPNLHQVTSISQELGETKKTQPVILSYSSASRETRSSNDDANVPEASNRHTCAGSVGMVSQRSQHFRQAFKDNKEGEDLPDRSMCHGKV